jgi:FkbM family methyltransferase
VLRNVPNVKIYAFEPGPHQFELFRMTIDRNELKHRIILYKTAISNVKGTLDFFVHNTKDVSGDGFIDTLRAGASKIIRVPTMPLDQWWLDENKPQIDFIKIDTEGAELWILQGAKELISTCKPIILTEMSDLNYINYPYSEIDVLNLLNNYNYIVYNEKREITDLNNLRTFQEKKIYTYYCIPRG